MKTIRRSNSTGTLILMIAFVQLIMFLALAYPADNDARLNKEWEEALEPLRAMPVQDFGFVRSAYTFAENHLGAIADARSFNGMSALLTVLRLMAEPQFAHTAPLMKIERPELAQLFGGKRISLDQYREPSAQERLAQLIQEDPQKWQKPINDLEGKARHLEELEHDFAIIPRQGEWLSPSQSEWFRFYEDAARSEQSKLPARDEKRIVERWTALKQALRANDPKAGGEAARALTESVLAAAREQGIALPRLRLDVFYHSHQPFAKSAFLYLLSALAYGAAILFGRRRLAWVGFGLLALGLLEQVIGITARWILAGRAPLSNMYESFTFAIAGMVLVALVFELINKTRVVGLGSAILGFIFMVLAHKLPIFDSQIRPLMPALQSSWLTYHVVTIMLSYSAFALSCFVSVTYLVKDALGGDESRSALVRRLPSLQAMDLFNYKIIAVGFPLLTLGIVLGAVWAATAWGRPWGFDPKETWSAITWLIYAIYLHARFLAGWKGRRAAILSLIGFAAVLFTYLGVNYLLQGLHSYV